MIFHAPSSPLALSKLLATATIAPKHAMAAKEGREDGTLEFLLMTLLLINPEVDIMSIYGWLIWYTILK